MEKSLKILPNFLIIYFDCLNFTKIVRKLQDENENFEISNKRNFGTRI